MTNKPIWEFKIKDIEMFFHPNVCHVCKSKGNLIQCPICRMISYCSEQHRFIHRPQHEKICYVIMEFNKKRNIWDNPTMTLEQWVSFKKENVQSMEPMLNRRLTMVEKRLFLYAKSCLVCRTQNDLTPCEVCGSVYVCANHELIEHDCEKLQQSLDLDSYYIYYIEKLKGIPLEYMQLDKDAVRDMNTFVQLCLRRTGRECMRNPDNYIHSDIFSKPLTLIYGMLRAQLFDRLQANESIVIHIIVDEPYTSYSISAWEILLHEIQSGKVVLLMIIVSKLWNVAPWKIYNKWKTCDTCTNDVKVLICFKFNISYYDFTREPLFRKPDVIIIFDVELCNEEEPTKIVETIQRQNCPVLLTAKSERKANNNVILIREALGSQHINPVVNEKNKFASLRPYRDDESDSVFYHSAYLTVYRDMNDSSDPVANSSSDSNSNNRKSPNDGNGSRKNSDNENSI